MRRWEVLLDRPNPTRTQRNGQRTIDLSTVQSVVYLRESHAGQLRVRARSDVETAAHEIRRPAHELGTADWHEVVDTNLTSAFLCSKAVYPAMQRNGGGKIISIGSMMSIFAASFAPAYAASKAGIVQFTKSIACAWARDNIQANAVLPGWIDTDLTRRARDEVPGLNENVLRRTPTGRWGAIDDMAGIAVFLASPASDFITGAAIPVDGGLTASMPYAGKPI